MGADPVILSPSTSLGVNSAEGEVEEPSQADGDTAGGRQEELAQEEAPIKVVSVAPASRFVRVLFACLLALGLIGLSFMVVLLPPVTHLLADATVNDQLGGFTHAELVAVADDGLAYVTLGGGHPLPIGTDERVAFTPEVISHLDDVCTVLRLAMAATAVLLLAVVLLFWFLRRKGLHARQFAPMLIAGGIAPLALTGLLGLIGFISFDALFTSMHQLFFADGTWTFSYDSLLIRTYPLAFWMGMAIVWAIALLVVSVVALGIGLRLCCHCRPPR